MRNQNGYGDRETHCRQTDTDQPQQTNNTVTYTHEEPGTLDNRFVHCYLLYIEHFDEKTTNETSTSHINTSL